MTATLTPFSSSSSVNTRPISGFTPSTPQRFHVALRAATELTPVYIRCQPTTLTKSEPWYRIPAQRPHFSLVVGEDLDLSPYRNAPLPLGSRALNEAMLRHFQQELAGRLAAET